MSFHFQTHQEEIDILAINKDKAIIGECKWRNELLGMGVVNSLIEKGRILNYADKYYILFSKSGFTHEVIKFSQSNEKIILVNDIRDSP
ncbi:DUF234 domain-containing protein [Marinisporobacter balticus]